MIPGEYRLLDEAIEANVGRYTFALKVSNLGDRPIQSAPTVTFSKSTGGSVSIVRRPTECA